MDAEVAELKAVFAPVAKDMALLGDFLAREFQSREPFIGEILQHIARFRGKQIRPALLFLARRLGSAGDGEADANSDHVKIGAVLELIHTATLVHDDILDDARLRRNVETVHRKWGERAAVLIGDYIYSRAFNLSTQVEGMARILSDTTHTICEGELLQIGNRYRPDIPEDDYFEIIRKKTAILYAVACELGGVLGGLGEADCRRLHYFGMQLGMAFQVVDDCLDYAGKEAVAGKSLGTDLRQGKVTLPLIYLRESLGGEEAEWLDGVLRAPLAPEAEERIHGLVERHGVLGDAFVRAEAFIQSGTRMLGELAVAERNGPLRESLELAADYVLRRQR